jgi:tetratricopeptide (TPR) repeat protein
MTAERMEAVRAQVRARAAEVQSTTPKRRRRASWIVWVLAFMALGGIGFGVAWFVMNPPGGDDPSGSESVASGEGEASGQAGGDESAADASESAGADAAAAADGGSGEAASADAGPAASEEVAVAAVADADESDGGADAGAVAAADAGPSDTAEAAEVAMLAANDAGSDGAPGDAAVAVISSADAAGDGGAVAAADGAGGANAAVVAVADAKAAEKPLVRDPIEATRLNEDGLAARKRGNHEGAIAFYEKALKADPNHVWARYNYACELALAKRSKEALTELTTLYKLGTNDAKKALAAARKDSDFASIKDTGQFFRLTNF